MGTLYIVAFCVSFLPCSSVYLRTVCRDLYTRRGRINQYKEKMAANVVASATRGFLAKLYAVKFIKVSNYFIFKALKLTVMLVTI